jgi:hypothetical protein
MLNVECLIRRRNAYRNDARFSFEVRKYIVFSSNKDGSLEMHASR